MKNFNKPTKRLDEPKHFRSTKVCTVLLALATIVCLVSPKEAQGGNKQTQPTKYTELKRLSDGKDVRLFADPEPSDCERNYFYTVHSLEWIELWFGTTVSGLDSIIYPSHFKILCNGKTRGFDRLSKCATALRPTGRCILLGKSSPSVYT